MLFVCDLCLEKRLLNHVPIFYIAFNQGFRLGFPATVLLTEIIDKGDEP